MFAEVPLDQDEDRLKAGFTLRAGERAHFLVTWADSRQPRPEPPTPRALEEALTRTTSLWHDWAQSCRYDGPYGEQVVRSALALKLLQHAPTGAIIATPTTSLPEELGGVRNWDYRFTWLRDAAQTVYALFLAGHMAEAEAYMDWTCAIARVCEAHLQVLYGVAGERDLPEQELAHLRGYRGSRPVRVGNAAAHQVQLDVYGELLDCVDLCRRFGRNRQSPIGCAITGGSRTAGSARYAASPATSSTPR